MVHCTTIFPPASLTQTDLAKKDLFSPVPDAATMSNTEPFAGYPNGDGIKDRAAEYELPGILCDATIERGRTSEICTSKGRKSSRSDGRSSTASACSAGRASTISNHSFSSAARSRFGSWFSRSQSNASGTDSIRSSSTSMSVKSLRSSIESHQTEVWKSPEETLIFIDWDDTLCPTTDCGDLVTAKFNSAEQIALQAVQQLLWSHQKHVIELLRIASTLGRVVIVTMATKTWFDSSLAIIMPAVAQLIEELNIEVVNARGSMAQRFMRQAMSDDRNASQFLKTKAMERIIKKFYKTKSSTLGLSKAKTKERSWKNIISIGDSEAERYALQDLIFRRQQRSRKGDWQECRCKTLLLLDEPSLQEVTAQICLLKTLVVTMVLHNADLHVDLDEEDLDTVGTAAIERAERAARFSSSESRFSSSNVSLDLASPPSSDPH